jgi:hypothetical protein
MNHRERIQLPGGILGRILPAVLFVGLAAILAGCATAPRPLPTTQEVRSMETRTMCANLDRTLDAWGVVLQDLSFSVDMRDPAAGLLVANKDTEVKLAEISPDPKPQKEGGMSTWQKVALIGTGAIVVAVVVWAITSDDDHDDKGDHGDKGKDHQGDDRQRGRGQDGRHDRGHGGGHGGGHDDHDGDTHVEVITVEESHPAGPNVYHYQLTVSLRPTEEGQTIVRVSGQGTRNKDGVIMDAGPIHDPAFYNDLFARLDRELAEQEVVVF